MGGRGGGLRCPIGSKVIIDGPLIIFKAVQGPMGSWGGQGGQGGALGVLWGQEGCF